MVIGDHRCEGLSQERKAVSALPPSGLRRIWGSAAATLPVTGHGSCGRPFSLSITASIGYPMRETEAKDEP
ncbi:hypothetical protein ACFOD7_06230 [Paracoccus fontiphilus]|uniref:Uncharacterized protein n=1 Tax=Paracoccus fontiphilus TaxID=1815556 RepID=A0ABV7ICK8_9RHOB